MTQTGTPESAPFTPAEWNEMRIDDKAAATAIVSLMIGIFVLGLAGYLAVCIWVA